MRITARKMSAQKTLLVAACALIDADGRVLMAQRPSGKDFAGHWEFPGGKVEPGETPEHAVRRELYEELNVEPCESCLQPFSFAADVDLASQLRDRLPRGRRFAN